MVVKLFKNIINIFNLYWTCFSTILIFRPILTRLTILITPHIDTSIGELFPSGHSVKRTVVNNYRSVTATRYATRKTARGECNHPRLDAAEAKKRSRLPLAVTFPTSRQYAYISILRASDVKTKSKLCKSEFTSLSATNCLVIKWKKPAAENNAGLNWRTLQLSLAGELASAYSPCSVPV